MNQEAYQDFPDIQTIAEESTAWPMVSRPTYIGGLGFGMKWDMGWMHDTLLYMSKDPIHRKYHHNKLTFRGLYAFTENFVLPLSHDEVVHGKGSLYRQDGGRRVAEVRQPAAAVRLHVHPAGQEAAVHGRRDSRSGASGTTTAASTGTSLGYPPHQGVQRWVRDLNTFYRSEPALYETDFIPDGWRWIDADDSDNSVLTYMRCRKDRTAPVVMACNFTPVPRRGYRVGVPHEGHWREVLNSNAAIYGGTDEGNFGGAHDANRSPATATRIRCCSTCRRWRWWCSSSSFFLLSSER